MSQYEEEDYNSEPIGFDTGKIKAMQIKPHINLLFVSLMI